MTVLTRGAFPASALFHEWLRSAHVARLPAVPRVDGAGAHAADVRREEHDVRRGPAPRPLPHGVRALPWPHVDEGGQRWTAISIPRAEQRTSVDSLSYVCSDFSDRLENDFSSLATRISESTM